MISSNWTRFIHYGRRGFLSEVGHFLFVANEWMAIKAVHILLLVPFPWESFSCYLVQSRFWWKLKLWIFSLVLFGTVCALDFFLFFCEGSHIFFPDILGFMLFRCATLCIILSRYTFDARIEWISSFESWRPFCALPLLHVDQLPKPQVMLITSKDLTSKTTSTCTKALDSWI